MSEQHSEKENITLSVVMPAYNEGKHIRENLAAVVAGVGMFVKRYEIIAVNDGSKDDTEAEIRAMLKKEAKVCAANGKDPHIRCVSYNKNRGKGHAIRSGVAQARGQYIAFLDSDLELPVILLKRMLFDMKNQHADIVIGSKLHPESKIHYPFVRRVMSYGYYLMLKCMFHLKLHDTQTGIKLFRADVIRPIAAELNTEGYAFDIEILAKASKAGYRIIEAPVALNYSRDDSKGGRRIRLHDIWNVFRETWSVWRELKKWDPAISGKDEVV